MQVLGLAVGVPAVALFVMGTLSYLPVLTSVVLGASTVLMGVRLRQYYGNRAESSDERTVAETVEGGSTRPLENVERHSS